jgi:hypothetical protein
MTMMLNIEEYRLDDGYEYKPNESFCEVAVYGKGGTRVFVSRESKRLTVVCEDEDAVDSMKIEAKLREVPDAFEPRNGIFTDEHACRMLIASNREAFFEIFKGEGK